MIYPLVFWVIVLAMTGVALFRLRGEVVGAARQKGKTVALVMIFLAVAYMALLVVFATLLVGVLSFPLESFFPAISDSGIAFDAVRLVLALVICIVMLDVLNWEMERPDSVQEKALRWLAGKIIK